MEWFLSVTDHIVEFVPSQQKSKDGINMEVIDFSLFIYIYLSVLSFLFSIFLHPALGCKILALFDR